ncbi:MAG: ParB/RepB/Spo0J family partition protein [Clostridia bacterium]|nr:ParB/RepB/Spo0J family partition protein [Clostridia bacterium]
MNENEHVEKISIDIIDDFPDHPFKVQDDDSMTMLIESISENGILYPIICQKKEDGRYEIISGHRRKYACEKLGISEMPVIERKLTKEEAIIAMVDSNLQRESILPSEKAKAYKMKMDAMKKQGQRTDLTLSPVATKLNVDTASSVGETFGESRDQVFRYIRLNELVPELLDLVDEGKIGLRPAVELSYLTEGEQRDLVETIETEECTPSHDQAIRMRKLSQQGILDMDTIFEIMRESKGNQNERVKIPMERLSRYFARGTPPKQVEDTIIKALEYYSAAMKRKRDNRDSR